MKKSIQVPMINCTLRFVLLTLLVVVGQLSVSAQDLLADHAPVDKKLGIVDSLVLQQQIDKERMEYPAMDIYPSWQNQRVHAYGGVPMPSKYVIDLKDFCLPTTRTRITDRFGYRRWRHRVHYGIDIKVYTGDTIRAAFSGKVRMIRYERRGYGNYVVIRHDNGLETIYGHLSKHLVKENQYVDAGTPIGLGGNTGRSTGSHLHFEVRFLGQAIDPAKLFDFKHQDILADSYTFEKVSHPKVHYYKVRRGDTLSKIAARQRTSVRRLCKLNHISTRTTLRIGMLLKCG